MAAWRLPSEHYNADRSILRPKRNDICQAICEAHVDISCSQERRVVAQFAKKLQKSLCSVWQTALPYRFPNISSAAQYHDKINIVYGFHENTAVHNIPKWDALADLFYYVNPDSSRKTCKYKHSSYREYVKEQKEKRLRGLRLLTDKEHIRWLYFNTPSEPTGSTFMRSI
ncbi:hypothetical protein T09_8601 [Trichinella sp. T9]|nr:hypothetical protein T09_8601 [Trichinella sp. T9]